MDIEQIKQSVKITDLAESLGVKVINSKAHCIWHQEKTPSLSFDNEKGIYKCFGCGKAGDIFSLYQEVKGVSFKEAFEDLGGDKKIAPQKINVNLYEDLINHLTLQGRGEEVETYLTKERGLEPSVLDKFRICGIKDLTETKKYLNDRYGITQLKEAGLVSDRGFLFNSHPVIIPVYQGGKIVCLRGRSLDDRKIKYLSTRGVVLPMFNSDILEKEEQIYLTEGEFDAIMLNQLGVKAVGIFGTNNFKDEFKSKFINKDVILAFDSDEAGQKATKEIAEKLKEVAESIRFLKIPKELKDVSDCFVNMVMPTELPTEIIKEGINIQHLADIADEQGDIEIIPTGFEILDEAFGGGVTKGGVVVIAGLAGEGKTAMMQTVSYHFAKQGHTCLWFSYEEQVKAIWDRFKQMGLGREHIMLAPTDLEDNKINYIEKVIQKQKKSTEFFVVFIDQLSHIAPKVTEKDDINHMSSNFSLYLGRMSQQLKDLAMKYNIVVVFAHQLGRTGDLAYSDMVRHAPDKVIYIKREEASPGSPDQFTNKTFCKINKNRPLGTRPSLEMGVREGRFQKYNLIDFLQK